MRIAVLTTTYNMAGTLGDALASVARQSRKPDLHVIVDDASTDDSYKAALCYKAQSPYPVHVIHFAENRGHAGALNAGITHSRSLADWYVKLDADDHLFPDALERIEAATVSANVVFAPFQVFGDFTFVRHFPRFNPETMTEECQIPGPSAFNASLWDAVGGFDATMRYGEDWDFWVRAERAVGLKPVYLETPLWHYRVYRTWKERHADQSHQDLFRTYWREHTRETVLARSRTWATWCQSQMLTAAH